MAQVLMVLFNVASDGTQTVVSVESFNSRDEAETAFNQTIAKLQATPNCNDTQLDLVDQQGITANVVPYSSVEYGNQVWTQWLALTPGAISPANLGGDYRNQETAASSDCSLVPFNPTPGTDGSPAVPLTTAAIDTAVVTTPTTTAPNGPPAPEAPITPAAPVLISTALVAAPTAHELALTGAGSGLWGPGPVASFGLALTLIGVAVVRKARRLSLPS